MSDKIKNWEYSLLPSLINNINYIVDNIPENGVFYDVGANTGLLSQMVLNKRPDVKFYLFEPIMEFCQYMYDKFSNNSNVAIINTALMHERGVFKISKDHNNLGYNTINFIENYGIIEEVPVMTLSEAYKEFNLPEPDFIKADIEQSECYFIDGCKELFNNGIQPSKILMEIGIPNNHHLFTKEKEMIEYLFSLGYKRFDYDKSHTYDAIFEK
jgi:FkbM family methyltransferase